MTPQRNRGQLLPALVIAMGTALALAACSGTSVSTSTPAASEPSGEPETSELLVGVTPVGDFAPIYYAVAEGIFEKNGLKVTIDPKGASEVPPLLANSYQAVSMSWTTFIQAAAQDVPLRPVFPGITGGPDTQTGIYVMPDSGVENADDLVGKTIAINQPKASAELNSRVSLDDAGVDPESVTFQVLPLPTLVDSLSTKKVDAAYLFPPFSTQAEDLGAKLIVDAYDGSLDGTPVAGFVMTADFVANNPNTIAAFQKSLTEATATLSGDTDLYREFITTYTQLTPEVAQKVPAYTFPSTIDVERLQDLADIMAEKKFSTQKIDVSESLVQPAG